MPGTEHFDQAARTWDGKDRRVALAPMDCPVALGLGNKE